MWKEHSLTVGKFVKHYFVCVKFLETFCMCKNSLYTALFSVRAIQFKMRYPIVIQWIIQKCGLPTEIFRRRTTNYIAVTMEIVLWKLFLHIQKYMKIPWKMTHIIDYYDVFNAMQCGLLCPANYEKPFILLSTPLHYFLCPIYSKLGMASYCWSSTDQLSL